MSTVQETDPNQKKVFVHSRATSRSGSYSDINNIPKTKTPSELAATVAKMPVIPSFSPQPSPGGSIKSLLLPLEKGSLKRGDTTETVRRKNSQENVSIQENVSVQESATPAKTHSFSDLRHLTDANQDSTSSSPLNSPPTSPGGKLTDTVARVGEGSLKVNVGTKGSRDQTPNDTPPETPRRSKRVSSTYVTGSGSLKQKKYNATEGNLKRSSSKTNLVDSNPSSPGGKEHRHSSLHMTPGRGSIIDTELTPTTGSEASVGARYADADGRKSPLEDFHSLLNWISTNFEKKLVGFPLSKPGSLLSKPQLVTRGCQEIAKDLMNESQIYEIVPNPDNPALPKKHRKKEGHFIHLIKESLRKLPDSVKAYDIVKAFVDFLSKSLEDADAGFSEYWKIKFQNTLERTIPKDHWKDNSENHKRSAFIEQELPLLVREKTKEKAAGIFYYLLFHSEFADLAKLPWLKAIALGMSKKSRKMEGIKTLANKLKLEVDFEKAAETTDPYESVKELTENVKKIFTEKGYMHPDLSNKEMAANILKVLLEAAINTEPFASSRAKLEMVYLVILGQCSSDQVSYPEWHKKIKRFLRNAAPTRIACFLEPLSKGCRSCVQTLESKLGELSKSEHKKKKAEKMIASAQETLGYLRALITLNQSKIKKEIKDLEKPNSPTSNEIEESQGSAEAFKVRIGSRGGIGTDEDVEYIISALFFLKILSLQMAQNILEMRVSLYHKKEAEMLGVRTRGHGQQASELELVFDEIMQPTKGPWMYFMFRYHDMTTKGQESQECVKYEEFGQFTGEEAKSWAAHRREASISRSQFTNPFQGALLTIGESTQVEIHQLQVSKMEIEFRKREYERRCWFFTPVFRRFHKFYLENSPYAKILEGHATSDVVKKPFNTIKDNNSTLSNDLKLYLIKHFKEFWDNADVRQKLFPITALIKTPASTYVPGMSSTYVSGMSSVSTSNGTTITVVSTVSVASSSTGMSSMSASSSEVATSESQAKRDSLEVPDFEVLKSKGEEQYRGVMEGRYKKVTTDINRTTRLFRLSIDRDSVKLRGEIEELLKKQQSAEALEEKRDSTGAVKMAPKLTERDLLNKELELLERVFRPSNYGAQLENQIQVTRLFEELFCSTLDMDPAKVRVKRKKTSASQVINV